MIGLNRSKDLGPIEFDRFRKIESTFQSTFKSFGFQRISLPAFESSDLFLKNLGDRMKSQMFIARDQNGTEICLRPEMTSPSIRYFLAHQNNEPLPLKLCYSEKVFRNQSEHSYREFTHIGTEIIGIDSIFYDAENIALASSCLDQLGLNDYQITLGNPGILVHLVNHLDVDVVFKNSFLENLRMKQSCEDMIQQAGENLFPSIDEGKYRDIFNILKKLTSEEEKTLLLKLLNMIHPHFSEDLKEAEDVVDGILDKIKRQNQYDSIQKILDFSQELHCISGRPKKALQDSKKLLEKTHIDLSYVEDLEKVTQFLYDYGIPEDRITIDFGLGRNLQYYTGVVFELDYLFPSGKKLICGGGRYDDLIETLGYPKPLSGCGFAFHLEEVYKILLKKEEENIPLEDNPIDLFFLLPNEKDYTKIFPVIRQLRDHGLNIYTDISSSNINEKLDDTRKSGIPLAALFGEDQDSVKLFDFKTDHINLIPYKELVDSISK